MARTGQTLRRRTAAAIAQRSSGRVLRGPSATGWRARVRYHFDNTMSRGTPALVAWLTVATVLLVLAFAALNLVFRLRSDRLGFWGETFSDLLHSLDPGTVAADTGNWRFLVTMLVLTVGGLFIVSALIGVVSAGIDMKIADLQRGRSVVLERDHTVILGWSDSIFTVVGELILANQSRGRAVIAILADRDRVAMEEELRAKLPDRRGTRVVCRSGSPMDVDDLMIVSPDRARSVIVLSPDPSSSAVVGGADADAQVIKSLLALRAIDGVEARVVAQLREPANMAAARLIDKGRPTSTSLLDIRETLAKLVVQTSRQSGAAAVYHELFDYEGDEIYFYADHGQTGTYADAQLAWNELSVIGITVDGRSTINPPPQTPVADATLIVVAEDDSRLAGPALSLPTVDESAFSTVEPEPAHPGRAVLLGWNERGPLVLRELEQYAAPGSRLTVVTAYGDPQPVMGGNLEVEVVRASTTDRGILETHVHAGLDQVLVLCYSDDLDAQAADAKTLVTLLHVRDILEGSSCAIVSEMMDDRNRVLAQVADVDDVVVSGEFVSLVVTQLAEDARLEPVLDELLQADGSEIHLRPAHWYVTPGVEVRWATVVAAASRRGESAIGFASAGLATDGAHLGVVVNPPKDESLTVESDDRVVVLADH